MASVMNQSMAGQVKTDSSLSRPHGRATIRRGLTLFVLVMFGMLYTPVRAQNVIQTPAVIEFQINKFEILGPNPIGEARAQALLQPYLGRHTGLERLQQATQALEKFLQSEGFGLYQAVLPEQEVGATIRIHIEAVRIASLKVSGAALHSSDNIRASVPDLRENTSPNMSTVARQLFIANENASKKTVLRLLQTEEAGQVNATLEVEDSKVWSGLVGLSNSGTRDTGRSRLMGVVQHNNLFDRDHVMSLAFTTSPERPQDVRQFGVNYRMPLYGIGGAITAAFSQSSVNSGALGTGQVITGRGSTLGVHYTHYLHPLGPLRSSLSFGIDDRLYKAATIGGVVIGSGDVRSRPVRAVYQVQYQPEWGNANGLIAYTRNLAWGGMNTDAAYAANRAGADRSWDTWSASYGMVARLPAGWLMNANGRAQYASEPLISGEQYGLGGANSLRGLEERSVIGESGVSLSLEVWSPELRKGLRALGFVDMGHVRRNGPAPGSAARESLISAGLGLRYTIDTRGSVALDYGRVVRAGGSAGTEQGSDRLHVSVLLQF